jgi:hypothetical protein
MAKLLGGYAPDDQKPASKRAKVTHGLLEENIPLPSSSEGAEALPPMQLDGAEVPEKTLPCSSKGVEALPSLQCDGAEVPEKMLPCSSKGVKALPSLQCDGAEVPEKKLPGSSKGVQALALLQYDGPEVQEKMLPPAEITNKINRKQTEVQVQKPHNSDMLSSATQGTNAGSFNFQNCTVSVVFQN